MYKNKYSIFVSRSKTKRDCVRRLILVEKQSFKKSIVITFIENYPVVLYTYLKIDYT